MGSSATTFFSSIFNFWIAIDARAPNSYVLTISQSGLGLPDRDYYLSAQFAEQKAAYLRYITTILTLIGWPEPAELSKKILQFETAIAQASWTMAESRDVEKTYNPMAESALVEAAPFAWRRFLQAADIAEPGHLVVAQMSAVEQIAEDLPRYPYRYAKSMAGLPRRRLGGSVFIQALCRREFRFS